MLSRLFRRNNEQSSPYPLLNEQLSKRISELSVMDGTLAHCYGCNMIYIDNVYFLGSILCPNCQEYALLRGINEEKAGKLSDAWIERNPDWILATYEQATPD